MKIIPISVYQKIKNLTGRPAIKLVAASSLAVGLSGEKILFHHDSRQKISVLPLPLSATRDIENLYTRFKRKDQLFTTEYKYLPQPLTYFIENTFMSGVVESFAQKIVFCPRIFVETKHDEFTEVQSLTFRDRELLERYVSPALPLETVLLNLFYQERARQPIEVFADLMHEVSHRLWYTHNDKDFARLTDNGTIQVLASELFAYARARDKVVEVYRVLRTRVTEFANSIPLEELTLAQAQLPQVEAQLAPLKKLLVDYYQLFVNLGDIGKVFKFSSVPDSALPLDETVNIEFVPGRFQPVVKAFGIVMGENDEVRTFEVPVDDMDIDRGEEK